MSEVENKEEGVKIVTASEKIFDTMVYFQVMFLKDSYFIWVSTENNLSNFHIGCHQPRLSSIPSISTVFQTDVDNFGQSLAGHLAKKTGKVCYVSYNIAAPQYNNLVVQKILQMIK